VLALDTDEACLCDAFDEVDEKLGLVVEIGEDEDTGCRIIGCFGLVDGKLVDGWYSEDWGNPKFDIRTMRLLSTNH